MTLVLTQPERFAALYRAHLEPWLNDDLSRYVGAISQMFEDIYDLSADVGLDGDDGYVPGWGSLLDVDSCKAAYLPFLGQFVGVLNLQGVGETVARALIRAQVAAHRGTPQAIISSARATLTGTQTVALTERYLGDAYRVQVITYTSETPDQSVTLAAINAVKPAGILVTYTVADGWTIGQMETFYAGSTIGTVEGTYSTIENFESQITG